MLGKHFTTELHPTLGLGYFLKWKKQNSRCDMLPFI
jgi:hypothetical protein